MIEQRRNDRVPVLLILAGLVGGLVVLVAATPIAGRGDYGQWLMTSRYYLGQTVPDYRSISALPPLVPVLLSALRLVVADPVVALQIFNVLLLGGLVGSFYLAGVALFESRFIGLLAVAIGMLITDRFLELFAFGGLLQSAAVMFTSLSVAAFARAGRGPDIGRRWWAIGAVSLALATLSHGGTGLIAVPVGLSLALLGFLRLRQFDARTRFRALLPLAMSLLVIAAYWLVILLPASQEYVSNPASLNYRGPERLFSGLLSYWPTVVVLALGGGANLLGALGEIGRRQVGGHLILLVWTGVAWGTLALSIASGASTDYPRFATPLLAPLVVGAASGLLWLGRSLAAHLNLLVPRASAGTWLTVATAAFIVAATPFAAQKYQNEAAGYEPRDAHALSAVVGWLDQELPRGEAVLSEVRDGKWLEGISGRAALFSLPVRYSFRQAEWARAMAATTLLQSAGALANQFFFAKFSDGDPCSSANPPNGFTIGMNHGGEFVDLLKVATSQIRVLSADAPGGILASISTLAPASMAATSIDQRLELRSSWKGVQAGSAITYIQTTSLADQSATLDLGVEVQTGLPITGLELDLLPVPGMAITSVGSTASEADVTFTRLGLQEPHLRLVVADGGTVEETAGGGLRVRTASPQLRLLVTDLSASSHYSSDLRLLCASQLRDAYDIGAVILALDPSFSSRQQRMERLGFHLATSVGPYAVMLRNRPTVAGQAIEP